MIEEKTKLKRELNLFQIVLYGLGNILGAGIYALIGIVAAKAGYFTPLSFIVALVLAVFTALSYMEFSSRCPLCSGEAYYIHKSFNMKWLSTLIGSLIAFAGLISSAVMLKAFVGYFKVFLDMPEMLLIIIVILLVGAISIWGINESVWVAATITVIETGGLLFIIFVAGKNLGDLPAQLPNLIPTASAEVWQSILIGAFIAFYAFIGFEDMVTIAEEVKEPKKNMPLALFFAFLGATVIYLLISFIAVLTIDPEILAYSNAPISLIYEMSTGKAPVVITIISMLAVLNGSLVQIIKASRMVYGMSIQKWLPKIFSSINSKTQTPIPATILVVIIILSLALIFPLEGLATATSFTVLTVFGLVNLGLFKIKREEAKGIVSDDQNFGESHIDFPKQIPFLGFIFSFAIIIFKIFNS